MIISTGYIHEFKTELAEMNAKQCANHVHYRPKVRTINVPWYLYYMVAQNMLRTCEVKNVFSDINFKFAIALAENYALIKSNYRFH